MNIFIGVVVAVLIAVFAIAHIGKRKIASRAIFDGYLASVTDAAAEGERAFRAQVVTLGGSPSTRGIALARLATALFPVAAYAASESSSVISPSVAKFSPSSGKEVWNLASGAALESLGEIRGTPYFKEIKDDTHYSIDQFINLINSVDILSPSDAIGPAVNQLSPIWCRAFEVSGIPKSELVHGYAAQYVTSGIHQFVDVFGLLASSRGR